MIDLSVSVVMPTHNRADFIEAALDSLSRQSRPPDEVIVVDDESTDDTEARVRRHPLSPRITYLRQVPKQGASNSRNLGVKRARSPIIVFLDSDDFLEADHLEAVTRAFRDLVALGLYCCDASLIGPGGAPISDATYTETQLRISRRTIASGPRSVADIFLFSTPFPGMAVSKNAYESVGGLDQEAFPLDDVDLQMKIAAAGYVVHYEHRPLARYRVHGTNESGAARGVRVGRKKLRCLQDAATRYEEVRRLGFTATRRVGEARRELALALLKEGSPWGLLHLGRSLFEDPAGLRHLVRIAARKF